MCHAGERFVFFGIEDVKDCADEQSMSGFIPVITPLETTIGIDEAAARGVTSVIQPGGSRRDEEVIAAADEHDMLMVVTGRRHFRH